MSEIELVKACLKGDLRAQKQLYVVYAPKVKGICLRYAASTEEAEDMLQEAFIRIFSKLNQFKNDGPLGAWIRRVVVNTAAEIYRRDKKLRNHTDIDKYSAFISDTENILSDLSAGDIAKKIRQLPDGYRVVFNMFAVEGYSHREIADTLGVTENTSKSQYCRARNALKVMIENEILEYHAKVG
jgi:RNA polymerase sigma-70 factor (ECF subfamily)